MKFGILYNSKQEYKYSEYYLDYEYLKDNILNDNCKGIHGLDVPQHKRTFQISNLLW